MKGTNTRSSHLLSRPYGNRILYFLSASAGSISCTAPHIKDISIDVSLLKTLSQIDVTVSSIDPADQMADSGPEISRGVSARGPRG